MSALRGVALALRELDVLNGAACPRHDPEGRVPGSKASIGEPSRRIWIAGPVSSALRPLAMGPTIPCGDAPQAHASPKATSHHDPVGRAEVPRELDVTRHVCGRREHSRP